MTLFPTKNDLSLIVTIPYDSNKSILHLPSTLIVRPISAWQGKRTQKCLTRMNNLESYQKKIKDNNVVDDSLETCIWVLCNESIIDLLGLGGVPNDSWLSIANASVSDAVDHEPNDGEDEDDKEDNANNLPDVEFSVSVPLMSKFFVKNSVEVSVLGHFNNYNSALY